MIRHVSETNVRFRRRELAARIGPPTRGVDGNHEATFSAWRYGKSAGVAAAAPIVGRVYLERGRSVVVLARWAGAGPRNVLVQHEDGTQVVRPFRGLRRPERVVSACASAADPT
jgi:acetyl esterase